MAANQSNLATTFTAQPVGQLIDESGSATQRFLIWLNTLFKRFLIIRANLVQVSSNYRMQLNDCTIQCLLKQPNPIVLTLPDPTQIQGQVYFIKNDAISVSTASLAATGNALVDNAAPSSVVLAPGQVVVLESDGTNWIKVGCCGNSVTSSSPAASSINSANGGVSVPLNSGGIPSSSQPIPPGTPAVTTLPVTGPLVVVGQIVTLNGSPYRYTTGLVSGGYWALDVTGSPSIIAVWSDLASHPAAGYAVGTVFYATDRQVSYAVQNTDIGLQWIYYNGISENTLALIPMDLGATSRGFLFRASDYLHNWLWTGTGWSLNAAALIGFQGGLPPGSTLFANPGPPFGGTSQFWQLCDGSTVPVSQENATLVNTTVPTIANTWFVR